MSIVIRVLVILWTEPVLFALSLNIWYFLKIFLTFMQVSLFATDALSGLVCFATGLKPPIWTEFALVTLELVM